ncbi:thiamine pyrophosphate-binding protein [Nocardioides sp. AE5]|uniref:thiamine pyrophosphate-binding protein n=1 Tax=Nocardioides sp. AE5 TaxID=2962573 RepID=UPI0028825230|nr:thiamine pyrophosphate-binding protein [Nocardioides sp. AE5]MDT0202486.1 thiamine pyrophosphate-binding protein [Nocardioides sp. AE5]
MSESATVARRCLELITEAGVPRLFGIPGVHNLAFWRDWSDEMPPIVGVRHEQTTVYAADGLARATGGLGVALTTTGPGAANAAGAFGEAAAAKSPVVLIASEVATRFTTDTRMKGVLHQSRDQAGIFEPLAKAVFRPRTAQDAVSAVREAIACALSAPRGPVYVDIPTDVLSLPAEALDPPAPEPRLTARADQIEAAQRLLGQSERAVIWCGGGVVQSGAEEELVRLAEVLDAPVVTTYAARGVVPPEHPSHVALPPHEPEIAGLVGAADLLFAIGTDFDGMMTRNWSMPMPPGLITVNCDADDLTKNYAPDVAVQGDAREVLRALLEGLEAAEGGASHVAGVEAGWARLRTDATERPGIEFVASIDSAIEPEHVVVCDMAVAGYWYGGYGRVLRARQLQYPVGWGTLGFALPAAIGPASVGTPTLAICGDGGVMFALSELATVAQESLPVTLLVVDDGAYGMLAYDQEVAGDPRAGVDLVSPDWEALGQAFGIPTTMTSPAGQDLGESVRAALATRKPALVVHKASFVPPRTTSARWAE